VQHVTRRSILAVAPALAFGTPLLQARPAHAKQYGPRVNTAPSDFAPIKQVQMARFNGCRRRLFGPILTGGIG
jgi:hypothetical protein